MSNPFDNLSEQDKSDLFNLLGVHFYKFNKGEEILPTIKHENIICIVMEGSANIMYIEYNGNEIIIEKLEKYSVFSTNVSATNKENCQIIAKENTEILVIDYKKLMAHKNIEYPYFNIFLQNLFDIINSKIKEKNERINILEKKQIREKLLEYFDVEYKKYHSSFIYLPFSLKDFADYLAVNRSAMFRELKNLKEENFIDIKNRRITLLYKG